MDISQLKYFISVAQSLNFSEAARQNNIPQPRISRNILELESQLGVQLLSRTKWNVFLTREGEAFLPFAIDIVDTAQRAEYIVEQVHSGRSGYLSIATVSTTAHLLTAVLSEFSRQYRDIIVDITQNSGSTQARAMMENRFDFHFMPKSMLPEDGRLEYLDVCKDQLVLVVPRGHRLLGLKLDFADFYNERFIMISQPENPQLYSQITDIFTAHRCIPKVIQRYDKAESVLLSVGSGLGLSILPMGLTKAFLHDAVETIPLDGDTEIDYVCAWPKHQNNPSSKLFIDVLQKLFPGD